MAPPHPAFCPESAHLRAFLTCYRLAQRSLAFAHGWAKRRVPHERMASSDRFVTSFIPETPRAIGPRTSCAISPRSLLLVLSFRLVFGVCASVPAYLTLSAGSFCPWFDCDCVLSMCTMSAPFCPAYLTLLLRLSRHAAPRTFLTRDMRAAPRPEQQPP
jgi:hypothetical protein